MTQAAARDGQSGVTLIEMMIVLAVVGVATGAATLALGALARDDAVPQAAQRLAAGIGLSVDEALISGVAQALEWDAQGYRLGPGARQVLVPPLVLARADGLAGGVALLPDATSPAVVFVLQGAGTPWHVAFDGLVAVAGPGAAPAEAAGPGAGPGVKP